MDDRFNRAMYCLLSPEEKECFTRDGLSRGLYDVYTAFKIGKAWRFRPADIERYIEENDNSLAGRLK